MSEADDTLRTAGSRRLVFLFPVVVFAMLAGLFFVALFSGDPSRLPSALIGKSVPEFNLPPLEGLKRVEGPVPGFSSGDLRSGHVTIVNVWASWCAPCRSEHPHLSELIARSGLAAYGLNYKDNPVNARRFLGQLGNPFQAVGADSDGRVSIDLGVAGVPETFLIDGDGIVRFKHVGPIGERDVDTILLPQITRITSGLK